MAGKKALTITLDAEYLEQLKLHAIEETYKRKQFVTHVELAKELLERAYPPKRKDSKGASNGSA